MRDPDRIEPFLNELGEIWKINCPDWRFGQLISNVFDDANFGEDPFYFEEDEMLERIKEYFGKEDK